ncbi:MAG: dihydrolipoyl dehydrogenase [Deltaproteobacteria bacterium]|nr:dihydrolipoyl dehydrogenase [Deltaproteobacteria bacterium]
MGTLQQEAELAIVGGGPGGYVAALRAADLGRDVVLVDERPRLGGTCLLEGCIPSKTLIHAVGVLEAAREARQLGITFDEPRLDLDLLRKHVDRVVGGLSKGIDGLLARRNVQVLHGKARFTGPHALFVEGEHQATIRFRHAIVAVGSRPTRLPAAGDLPVWSSTHALRLPEIPPRLIVVGGGYIGLELGQVFAGLGSRVTLVQFAPRLLPAADPDLIDVVVRRARRGFADLLVDSKVVGVERTSAALAVTVEHEGARRTLEAERVLVAVGRTPNTDRVGLEALGLAVDEHGRIPVDEQLRTKVPHVFAIGDAVAGPMLAHKASREAKVAAEVLSHHKSAFDNRAIPAVVYTDPELAWAGLTEREAQERGTKVAVGRFPLRALGRAWTLGRTEGLVKVLSEPESGRILGVGMVGPQASELIAEATLALELGATLEDLMVTIHPHPSLAESLVEAAEVAAGTPVHVNPARKP